MGTDTGMGQPGSSQHLRKPSAVQVLDSACDVQDHCCCAVKMLAPVGQHSIQQRRGTVNSPLTCAAAWPSL